MRYFTSDWHIGDPRIGVNGKPNLFYRTFSSIEEQNSTIIDNFTSKFKEEDELWNIGDVIVDMDYFNHLLDLRMLYPNSTFNLIIGNYDEDKLEYLKTIFNNIYTDTTIEINGKEYYLNHYPSNCIDKKFSICGHIHGLWKVQKNMINVGIDAWHYLPVSENEIDFARTACEKYYDINVFPY